MLALIAFMPTPAAGALGSLDYPKEERRRLARKCDFIHNFPFSISEMSSLLTLRYDYISGLMIGYALIVAVGLSTSSCCRSNPLLPLLLPPLRPTLRNLN